MPSMSTAGQFWARPSVQGPTLPTAGPWSQGRLQEPSPSQAHPLPSIVGRDRATVGSQWSCHHVAGMCGQSRRRAGPQNGAMKATPWRSPHPARASGRPNPLPNSSCDAPSS